MGALDARWSRAGATVTLVTVSLMGLVGCTSPGHTSSHPTSSSTTSPGAEASRAPSASSSAPAAASAPATSTSPTGTAAPVAAWNVAHDSGPTTGAEGTVAVDSHGVPVRYVVASGDTGGGICTRLHVRWWQLTSDGAFLGTYPDLSVGEVIDVVDVPESAAGDVQSSNALC